jgi:hypothetical protein
MFLNCNLLDYFKKTIRGETIDTSGEKLKVVL